MDFIQQCIDVKDDSWTLIITGDFNFPSICWKTLRFLSGGSDCGQCANVLLHFMELNMLSQVVDKPTRKAESGVENILDIVLTNSEESFREVETLDTSLSDHKYVSIILSDYFQGPKQNKNKLTKSFSHTAEVSFSSLNFHKADFEKINLDLGKLEWDRLKSDCTYDIFPEVFYETVLSICRKYTPLKQLPKKQKSKYHRVCHAINRKRRKIKTRLRALQQLQPSSRRIPSLQAKLISLEKEAQQKIMECKQNEEKKALHAMRTNPKFSTRMQRNEMSLKAELGPYGTPIMV